MTYQNENKSGRQKLREVLSPYGVISERLMDNFEIYTKLTAGEIADKLQEFFKNLKNPAEYLNKEGKYTTCSAEDAAYIWVSTGLMDMMKEELLYVAFTRNKKEDDPYESSYFCYCIAPYEQLMKNRNKYADKTDEMEYNHGTLLSDIYEMLLIKGDWARLPNYRVLGELIRLSEAKIINDEKQHKNNKNGIYNKDHTKVAYNPGLISIYGNDIILIADIDSSGDFTNRRIAQSKTQLRQEGFESVDISPVSFYQSRHDLIFSATAEDFDLDDFARMRHIIECRRERFPKEAREMPEDELFNKIRASLEFDLKMTARNPYWAAPFYNIKQDEVQYLLPLFIGSLSEKPSLAMIVGKGEHYYEVRTVLPLNLAYANAACLASPPSTWLKEASVDE